MALAAILGASVLGAGAQIFGAQTGAKATQDAAQQSIAAQLSMFNTMRQILGPFANAGMSALPALQGAQGNLSTFANNIPPLLQAMLGVGGPGGGPDLQKALAQTPGYQFTLGQGLESTQNSFAAQGLGASGAALKGAAQYATGLADNTFNQQLQNALNAYGAGISGLQAPVNAYQNLFNTGESAAAGVGSGALSTGQGVGSNLLTGGIAQTGANLVSGNAAANALTNPFSMMALYNFMQNQGSSSGIANTNLNTNALNGAS